MKIKAEDLKREIKIIKMIFFLKFVFLANFIFANNLCRHIPRKTNQRVEVHTAPDRSRFCCITRSCPPGFHHVVCNSTTTEVTCQKCRNESFMEHETLSTDANHFCHSMRECDPHRGMTTVKEGNSTTDRLCACDLQSGFYDYDYGENEDFLNPDLCMPKRCPAGKQLHKNGTCLDCEHGTYKSQDGYNQCIAWTKCQFWQERKGNKTHDVTCTSWRWGMKIPND